jgi:DNA invertase Pin-like site-specific DNA recombinase
LQSWHGPVVQKTKKPKIQPEPENKPFLVGYARVSTEEQKLDLQEDALRAAGVLEDNIHRDNLSATAKKRPGLDMAIKDLRPGDTLVVWRLDRLCRNMEDLYTRLREIKEQGASFRSLTEGFDFGTITGDLIIAVLGAVAQFERQIIAQRTAAGMKAAKDRGAVLGAPKIMTPKVVAEAGRLLRSGLTVEEVAKKLKVSKPSIYAFYKVGRSGDKVKITKRER